MSTPAAAGAATLARQYFTDGFYPTGAPVPAHAYQPSASLIRAVLVAGAETMRGECGLSGGPLYPPPHSIHQVCVFVCVDICHQWNALQDWLPYQ
jgi:hypothetical protein